MTKPTVDEIKIFAAHYGISMMQAKRQLTRQHHMEDIVSASTVDELKEAVADALRSEWGME